MTHHYTIETFDGIILTTAKTKKEAINQGRAEAIKARQSLTIHKVDTTTAEVVDYIAIVEFPVWLRDFPTEKLNIKDTTIVTI